VLPIVLWAFLSVVFYRHYRRLPAFIAVHALWDASIFTSDFVSGDVIAIWAITAVMTGLVLWILYRVDLSKADRVVFTPAPPGVPYR